MKTSHLISDALGQTWAGGGAHSCEKTIPKRCTRNTPESIMTVS